MQLTAGVAIQHTVEYEHVITCCGRRHAGLYGGVEYEVLSQHESSLIDWYYDIVHEALRDRGLDPDREANR